MRKIFLLVLGGALVFFWAVTSLKVKAEEATTSPTPALPQEESIYRPRLLPDSPFYFLKRIKERFELAFALAEEAKAAKLLEMATRRVAEAKIMAQRGKMALVKKLMERYQAHLDQALVKAKEAKNKGRPVESLIETITRETAKHQGVLEGVLERVPEPAQEAIERAIEVSGRGQEEAIKAVSGEKQQEVKEIIQEKLEGRPTIRQILEEKVPEVVEEVKELRLKQPELEWEEEEREQGRETEEAPEEKPAFGEGFQPKGLR